MRHTFDEYREALLGAAPAVKERLLAQADRELDPFQLRELQRLAYPDEA